MRLTLVTVLCIVIFASVLSANQDSISDDLRNYIDKVVVYLSEGKPDRYYRNPSIVQNELIGLTRRDIRFVLSSIFNRTNKNRLNKTTFEFRMNKVLGYISSRDSYRDREKHDSIIHEFRRGTKHGRWCKLCYPVSGLKLSPQEIVNIYLDEEKPRNSFGDSTVWWSIIILTIFVSSLILATIYGVPKWIRRTMTVIGGTMAVIGFILSLFLCGGIGMLGGALLSKAIGLTPGGFPLLAFPGSFLIFIPFIILDGIDGFLGRYPQRVTVESLLEEAASLEQNGFLNQAERKFERAARMEYLLSLDEKSAQEMQELASLAFPTEDI